MNVTRVSLHKKNASEVRSEGTMVYKCRQFKYLGSVFQEDGMIDENVMHKK